MEEKIVSELCHFGVPPYDEINFQVHCKIIKLDHQCDKILEKSSENRLNIHLDCCLRHL